jgi:NAD(P)-dependent dehydrogenase (short-subunit alcohol dehydrogenase family)
MSSISGLAASPYLGPYAASKFALEAITDCLRVELRTWGIRVSVVEPGNVKTPIWGKARASAEELTRKMPPEVEALYGADIAAMRRATARLAETGMPVERVVRAVVHALTARRPKTRYPVGAQTRLAAVCWRFLADGTRDWIMRRELGLP